MGTLLELQGANPFKSRAFQNAARAVGGISRDIGTLVESGELLEVKGIGKGIAQVITDLVKTGNSKDYADLRKSFPDGLLEMLRIQGLGPKRVKILYERLKIRSLDELARAAAGGTLATLEGFGEKTEQNILKGIEALKSRGEKILYPQAAEPAERMLEYMKGQKGVIRASLAGSIRRRKEIIGDIDLLLSCRDGQQVRLMDAFVNAPGISSVVAHGETKSTVQLERGINCDLRIVSDAEYPFALNYFTGSKEHNVELRGRAKRYGLSLNEYGFSRLGTETKRGRGKRAVKCENEADIYRALDLQYIPPELRENLGEIEEAEKGTLPALLEAKDIRGTLHCHTTYSDGVNTLEEMVDAARSLGWEYLGIGDHSKAAAYAGGLSEEKAKAQIKEIDTLNSRLKGFRIFAGTECDILTNGDLDWSEKVLSLFEYVVISVHSGFRMSEREMTRRIVKALKHKRVTMLGHPTGRLLLSRDAYPVNMSEVIAAAADYGKMIEFNAHPMRLDLDWRLCRYAREKGVLIPINPDAHNTDGLRDVSYGVGIARKGWLTKHDVLNTRSSTELEKLFSGKG